MANGMFTLSRIYSTPVCLQRTSSDYECGQMTKNAANVLFYVSYTLMNILSLLLMLYNIIIKSYQ